jgi:phosphoglycerate dehydrogenase-like enzyme
MASMPKTLILSNNASEYTRLIQQADLPDLEITSDPAVCDIALGEPRKIRDALPHLPHLKWAQSIYAGVEYLVEPGHRRDYILTNARGVFGGLMSDAQGLDYLVVVLPRTKDTDKIVNADLLDALPPHAVLINVGRGNAVDESALVEALTQGKLAAAVLDVTDPEPLPTEHPLWTTSNLFLTFHSPPRVTLKTLRRYSPRITIFISQANR